MNEVFSPSANLNVTMSATACDFFTVTLELQSGFLGNFTDDRKFWNLQRSLSDFAGHLIAVNGQTPVARSQRDLLAGKLYEAEPKADDKEPIVAKQEAMQSWETPLMHRMARKIAFPGARILEIEFGMGISATEMLKQGATAYTVIEANSEMARRTEAWAKDYPDVAVTAIQGRWQDHCAKLDGPYDGIFVDTYPESEKDWYNNALRKSCYADNFFSTARRLLGPEDTFTYYTGEIDRLGRRHQRKLPEHFSRFDAEICDGLNPPEDCSYRWNGSIVVVGAHAPK